jgi:hypothetical protein
MFHLDHKKIWIGWVFLFILIIIILYLYKKSFIESFSNQSEEFKNEQEYKDQVKKVNERFEPTAGSKRGVVDLLPTLKDMPESQQMLINFYSLACRYPGYIGPAEEGYFDPDIGIQMAIKAGCRTFVLDIDYLDDCKSNEKYGYFPHLVVRDIQGRLRIKGSSNEPLCNSPKHFNLQTICDKINYYAFADSCQQKTDPVIIVLYFIRQPPGSYKSKVVLDYYSNVAKALSPFRNRLLRNELDGGKFYRHQQEGKLLINKITDYNGKVLIFNNANTSGFKETDIYQPEEDLDFLTNLCLYYTQTRLGVTENGTGSMFGILQTADDYMVIPNDRKDQVVLDTKLRWTICLSSDPLKQISSDVYKSITGTYGVNCVPALLFDESNEYLFKENTFKKYGFMPKPLPLRYIKPPVVTPGEPNPNTDARQGKLEAPSVP